LYCDWTKRDSLLVSNADFKNDLNNNYRKLSGFGVTKKDAVYFLPPYEWYNDSIAAWTKALDLQLINFTSGTLSNADYTTPDMKNYRSSETILSSLKNYEIGNKDGFNGFILLMHIGTDPKRTDKLYRHLPAIIRSMQDKKYFFKRIDELLGPKRG
jgi:peptidoglycan/xylan/chitin deacetylase (PgdA/CDA1 family)